MSSAPAEHPPGLAIPGFETGGTAAVDRAAGDLRRGLPVVLAEPGEAGGIVAFAAEFVSASRLDALRRLGGEPDLAITHNRAATLKIRLYTPDVVRIPVPGWLSMEALASLADPATDLALPLRGPFEARRDPVPPGFVAAIRLAKIARLLPAAVAVEAADLAAALGAEKADLLRVGPSAVMSYDVAAAQRLERVTGASVPLDGAEATRIFAFRPRDGGTEHFAIQIGQPEPPGPVLARLHSECFTGDLLGSLKCDCGQQLRGAIAQISAEGEGILLYLAQEGRGIGLINKLRAYALQDLGFDTVEANERLGFEADERVFLPAAEMLRRLGYSSVRLMTNNPDKVEALARFGIEIAERVPHSFPSNDHNAFYLSTKAEKSGHLL
ncbi:MAG: GTP cyclohydrolase II [Defluviicoccus sp.]|nr:GTP cyclohydrolase II [Defluviicoccus sp.]MDE0383625.1 GTP cyclohydrolase II [Defluviicoccus sp.]